MQTIQSVVEHITKVYGFELVSPSIPRNLFQHIKRDFYLFILYKVSERLFYFLREVSPIKFILERPDKSIWFRKRIYGKTISELEIIPIPPEQAIYNNYKHPLKIINGEGNFRVRFYHNNPNDYKDNFQISLYDATGGIDSYFSEIPELKALLRDYKLDILFKNN